MALTSKQAAAVAYEENLILFAGPGSGKTSTSVAKGYKILSNPDNTLCMITFTSAAAKEMQERMEHQFRATQTPPPGPRFICGTFHSIALRHYQKHDRNPKKLLGPPAVAAKINGMLFDVALEQRNIFKLALGKFQGALNQNNVTFEHADIETFVHEYHRSLEATNTTDLAMVMRDCTTQMSFGNLQLLPITHLLGDEMQDADEVQLEMILAHTRKGVLTTLVADDDQTIYEWRSALGYAGLQRFGKEAKAKTIALSENFRSKEEIVDHAKTLIAHNNPERIEKNQISTRGIGGELGYQRFAGLDEQCKGVVKHIQEARQPGETIAVLARTNFALGVMGRTLKGELIPYSMTGPSIWDMPAVATAISTLKSLINNSSTSLQPLLSILPLENKARRELEISLGANCKSWIVDGNTPELTLATAIERKFLVELTTRLQSWSVKLAAGEISLLLPEVFECVLLWFSDHLRISKTARPTVNSQLKRTREAFDDAQKVLLKFKGKLSTRLALLEQMSEKDKGEDAIRLCTMHGSKGLEFDTVFLIDASAPADDDKGTLLEDEPAERRLFYVALTRAKERFFVFYSEQPTMFVYEAELPSMLSPDTK